MGQWIYYTTNAVKYSDNIIYFSEIKYSKRSNIALKSTEEEVVNIVTTFAQTLYIRIFITLQLFAYRKIIVNSS